MCGRKSTGVVNKSPKERWVSVRGRLSTERLKWVPKWRWVSEGGNWSVVLLNVYANVRCVIVPIKRNMISIYKIDKMRRYIPNPLKLLHNTLSNLVGEYLCTNQGMEMLKYKIW